MSQGPSVFPYLDSRSEIQLAYLRPGNRPKKATNVKKEMMRMAIKELRRVPIVKRQQIRAWPTTQDEFCPRRKARAYMGIDSRCRSLEKCRVVVSVLLQCCTWSRDPMSDVRAWHSGFPTLAYFGVCKADATSFNYAMFFLIRKRFDTFGE
jgi:hypothetical protein